MKSCCRFRDRFISWNYHHNIHLLFRFEFDSFNDLGPPPPFSSSFCLILRALIENIWFFFIGGPVWTSTRTRRCCARRATTARCTSSPSKIRNGTNSRRWARLPSCQSISALNGVSPNFKYPVDTNASAPLETNPTPSSVGTTSFALASPIVFFRNCRICIDPAIDSDRACYWNGIAIKTVFETIDDASFVSWSECSRFYLLQSYLIKWRKCLERWQRFRQCPFHCI